MQRPAVVPAAHAVTGNAVDEQNLGGDVVREGSVGVLRWDGKAGDFAYLDSAWLRTFTRHNWLYR